MEEDFVVAEDVMLEDVTDSDMDEEMVQELDSPAVELTEAQRNDALLKLSRSGISYGRSASKKFIKVLEVLVT